MAAFSTLAMLGLGLLGGVTAAKVMAPKPSDVQASSTGTMLPPVPAPTPPSAAAASSQAAIAANAAGLRQRRKAAAGFGDRVALPTSSPAQAGITASVQPKTLLGY